MENVHDFFKEIESEKSINRKAEMLQEQDNNTKAALMAIFRSTFDPRIKWLVPDSKPPFAENPEKEWKNCSLYLSEAVMSFGRFCMINGKLTHQALQARFRNITECESAFINMLKQLHTSEADLVMHMIKGKLPYKGLTPRLINQAFPGLLPE